MWIRALPLMAGLGLQIALAHHSGALGEPVRLQGRVVDVRMINPHVQITLAVEEEDGESVEWRLSAGTPAEHRNLGWNEMTVPVGSRVEIVGRPAGLGERTVDLDLIEFEDGRILAVNLPLSLQPGF